VKGMENEFPVKVRVGGSSGGPRDSECRRALVSGRVVATDELRRYFADVGDIGDGGTE